MGILILYPLAIAFIQPKVTVSFSKLEPTDGALEVGRFCLVRSVAQHTFVLICLLLWTLCYQTYLSTYRNFCPSKL